MEINQPCRGNLSQVAIGVPHLADIMRGNDLIYTAIDVARATFHDATCRPQVKASLDFNLKYKAKSSTP